MTDSPVGRPSTAPERLGILTGDRFCTGCGFNLVGQSVVREPHYGMLMVRCPECGAPAALQEYPLLGRWANRWARVLAAAMIVLMTGLTVVSSLACWGVSIPPVEGMLRPGIERLGEAHVKWQLEQAAAAAASPAPSNSGATDPAAQAPNDPHTPQPPSAPSTNQAPDPAAQAALSAGGAGNAAGTVAGTQGRRAARARTPSQEQDWWRRHGELAWVQSPGFDASVRQALNWSDAIDWSGLRRLLLSMPVALLVGVVYSVLMLGTTRRRSMLMIPLVLGLSTVWMLIDLTTEAYWGGRISDLAMMERGVPLSLIVYVCMAYAMAFGLWFGRGIARWFVALMLPPRLCGSLADLWLCDGKSPPSGAVAKRKQSTPGSAGGA